MKNSFMVAAAATIATTYAQWGSFAIVNYCDFDLYLWPVAGGEPAGSMITLPGGKPEIGYKEQFRETANGGGVSIKVSPNYAPGNTTPRHTISQLEYTVPSQTNPAQASVKHLIFYDLSWVDGDPFLGVPLTMQTSTGGKPGACPSGDCKAGEKCSFGYFYDKDDVKTNACGIQNDIIWSFCPSPGGSLTVQKGLLQTRDALPEPIPEAKAEAAPAAEAEADPLAVCVAVGSNVAQLCPDAPATKPSPTPAAVPKPVVALQQEKAATTTTTTAPPPPPVPSAPVPISNPAPIGGNVAFAALTQIADTPVKNWLSWNRPNLKRDVPHSHRHNHQSFHRRNRALKSAA